MKLDFDIETKGESLDFELKDTKVINTGGGVSENRVVQIVEEKTKDLQPKTDERLETESKEIVGAINELHNREDKQGLTEEQVKEIVQETLPDWAEQEEKPTYTYEEIQNKPEGLATEKYVDGKLGDIETALTAILGV
jgi:uncharacterized protein (UPF0335 family)